MKEEEKDAKICKVLIKSDVTDQVALCRDPSTSHWSSKNQCGWVEIWVDRWWWWTGKKMKEQKKSPKNIYIVRYTLKVSVNVCL